MVFKVWFCWTSSACKFSGPILDLLNSKLWRWGTGGWVLTGLLGDSDAMLKFEHDHHRTLEMSSLLLWLRGPQRENKDLEGDWYRKEC